MVKSCCVVDCTNRAKKSSGLSFCRFPTDVERRAKWIAAVKRENWHHSVHSWICSAHFLSGENSDDQLSPDYVPSVFNYVSCPVKRKKIKDLEAYDRRKKARTTRLAAAARADTASSLLMLNGDNSACSSACSSDASNQTDAVPTGDVSLQTGLSVRSIGELEEGYLQLSKDRFIKEPK